MQDEILITGGTGTLGSALVDYLHTKGLNKITVFSRDENKQKALKDKYPDIRCVVGDICNKDDLKHIKRGQFKWKQVFHCAAMKHIEICEDNVHKCVDVNYSGVKNTYWVHGRSSQYFTFFTTDKAVAPINAYGHSKALAEKYLQQFNNVQIFRWGNVLGSTGSFLPYLCNAIMNKKPVNVTDATMTRFWINIDDAIKFVIDNRYTGFPQPIYPKMISCSLDTFISAVEVIIGKKAYRKDIAVRPGEKRHENMIADYRGVRMSTNEDTLDINQMIEILEPWVKKYIEGL